MNAAYDSLPQAKRRAVMTACAVALARPLADVEAALATPLLHRAPFGLYAILNASPETSSDTLCRRARAIGEAPVAFIQLRAKAVSTSYRRKLARALCASTDTPIIVNDDIDTALEADAAGVHLGRTDGSAEQARARADALGRDTFIIGRSSNNAIQYRQAVRESVDYVALGPIFESPTKRGHAPPVGLDMLAEVAADAPRPLCAIGGLVDVAAICRAAFAGADLCAVVSALTESKDETAAAWSLCFAHTVGAHVRAIERGTHTASEDL